jgi:hypothetical protein
MTAVTEAIEPAPGSAEAAVASGLGGRSIEDPFSEERLGRA